VLKCLDELCYNRGQRITFGSSSANGILLFREACSAMSGYGQRIASITPPPHEAYASKYKGIAVALSMFSRCLDGGYVNFGVFALYGDPALNNGFETALKLMLSLPQDDVMVRDNDSAVDLFVSALVIRLRHRSAAQISYEPSVWPFAPSCSRTPNSA
jgi:exportin-7